MVPKRIKWRPKASPGFTLIELLIVVSIIGMLAAIAAPNFLQAQDRARGAAVASNTSAVQTALEAYAGDNGGSFPTRYLNIKIGSSGLIRTYGMNGGSGAPDLSSYLAGGKLPVPPWSPWHQSALGGNAPFGLKAASEVYSGEPMSVPGTAVPGSGLVMPERTLSSNSRYFGTIQLDVDANSATYVLYGMGKKAAQSIVVIGKSNAGQ